MGVGAIHESPAGVVPGCGGGPFVNGPYGKKNPPRISRGGFKIIRLCPAYFTLVLRSLGTSTTTAAPDRSRKAAHRPIWLSSPVRGEEEA